MTRMVRIARPERRVGRVLPAVTDAVALMAFVAVGLRAHHDTGVVELFARNAVPLLIVWFGVAVLLRTYRDPGLASLLRTWIVSVPLALAIRSIWVGSPAGGRLVVFVAVGLAFTLLFLLIGRGAATLITGRGYPQGGSR
jgi:Protein of unknown function (DUF3054)